MLRPTIAMAIAAAALATGAVAADRPPSDTPRVEAGRAIYEQNCASCHGAHAEGAAGWQKRDAHGEMPPPPHDATGHTWRHSDADLYAMVSKGWRDPFNKTERQTMPGFAGSLSPRQIVSVLDYLKTLWTPEERQFQIEESREHPFPPQAR